MAVGAAAASAARQLFQGNKLYYQERLDKIQSTTASEHIYNTLKRVRKKESPLITASQNLEDFDAEGIREMTRPLSAIPTHQFLFNTRSVDKRCVPVQVR